MFLSEEAAGLNQSARRCNVRGMSVNRTERALFDYIENHIEERQFWQGKVRELMRESRDDHANSSALAGELGRYFHERGSVGALPVQVIEGEGLGNIGFRSLAEHLMRIWGPVRPPRTASRPRGNEIP